MAWHGHIHRYVFAALDYLSITYMDASRLVVTWNSLIRCDSYDYWRLAWACWDLEEGIKRWLMKRQKARCDHVVARWRPKDRGEWCPTGANVGDAGSNRYQYDYVLLGTYIWVEIRQ